MHRSSDKTSTTISQLSFEMQKNPSVKNMEMEIPGTFWSRDISPLKHNSEAENAADYPKLIESNEFCDGKIEN